MNFKRFILTIMTVILVQFILVSEVYADDSADMTISDYLFEGETPFGASDMGQFLDNNHDSQGNGNDFWDLYEEGYYNDLFIEEDINDSNNDTTNTQNSSKTEKNNKNNSKKDVKVYDKNDNDFLKNYNKTTSNNSTSEESTSDKSVSNNTTTNKSLSNDSVSDKNDKKESETNSHEPTDDNDILKKINEKNSWQLILVNKQNKVPEDYEATLVNVNGGMQVRQEVATPLAKMLKAAEEDGVSLMICSAYRSYERQTELFNRKLNKLMGSGMSYLEAYRKGSYSVTIPGTSEHQLGMALDIVTGSYTTLDEGFGNTKAGKWLAKNAPKYGFILRYPKDKEHITGIIYEPWHFRYVGTEFATIITESGLTLEEFLEENGIE